MSPTVTLLLLVICILLLTGSLMYVLVVIPAQRREVLKRLESLSDLGESQSRTARGWITDAQGMRLFDEHVQRFGFARRLEVLVAQSGSKQNPGFWFALTIVCALGSALLCVLLQPPLFISLSAIVVIGSIPSVRLLYMRHVRLTLFETQFPDAIDVLARAVRAGYAFTSGLQIIADEMPVPVAQEFRKTYEQQNLGLPLRDALNELSVRVPLPDVRIFVSTLQIQSESGGNLAEVLDKLAEVVRERFRLLRQVRIYSAEGRMSLTFLMAFPPVILVTSYVLNPRYVSPLFSDPFGLHMLEGAVVLQIIGYFVIRRMVNFKV